MQFNYLDIGVFVLFIVAVISLGLYKSRKEKTSEDYFLAGRSLMWPLIGFSLIAANISTEQFVGMNGNAASHVGLAIASFEWMAAVTLVVVAFGFLPYFLRAGIYTIPEFLEYRYNATARGIMAIATIFMYMLLLGAVTYSGALTISTLSAKMGYNINLQTGSLAIGLIAMLYVATGGLKACAWADLIQGSALIIGGIIIMFFAFQKLGTAEEVTTITDVATGAITTKTFAPNVGALDRFMDLNAVRLNMFLPKTDKVLPWTALMLGLWIPNFYYWGLNQYITQRTLGSKSLAQGQKGIVFAAFMKLLIPFAIVIPGIIAFNLYSKDMQLASAGDNAPVMVKYQKANPATEFIQVIHDPPSNSEEIQDGKFAILVFNTKDQAKEFKSDNAYVLPITKEKFDESIESMEQYTFFASDDLAWKNIYPGFDAEINAYNADVNEAAVAADVTPNTEKMIVYKYDTALAHLLGNVLPQGVGLLGFILAALLGAVVSSLAAMLNAASTIFSMDIYKKYFKPDCSQSGLVLIGRICVVVFTIVAVFLAPKLGDPKINNSIFTIIQESQGLISPGILAVFVFGLLIRKGPPIAGVVGLLTNIVSYGGLYLLGRYKIGPEIQYLNRMAICFVLCLVIMGIITLIKPLAQPIEFKKNTDMDLTPSKSAKIVGIAVVVITVIFYLIFSPLGIAK